MQVCADSKVLAARLCCVLLESLPWIQRPLPAAGHQLTSPCRPGYLATIRAKFDLPAGVTAPQTYVHHCHTVEHEDNDMMRPFTVRP
jgi:FtsP/CotA-like multicopper oxidase with cupredoxin domain